MVSANMLVSVVGRAQGSKKLQSLAGFPGAVTILDGAWEKLRPCSATALEIGPVFGVLTEGRLGLGTNIRYDTWRASLRFSD